MQYLMSYIKNNVKFEVVKDNKAVWEHFFGKFIQTNNEGFSVTKVFCENNEYILKKDQIIEMLIYTPKGVYSLECKILKQTENGYEISFPLTARHSQRREYLRVDIQTKIKADFIFDGDKKTFEGLTADICAGGLSFDIDYKIDNLKEINIDLVLNEKNIQTKGELVYSIPVNKNGKIYFHTGIVMTTLRKEDIAYITDVCFKYIGNA